MLNDLNTIPTLSLYNAGLDTVVISVDQMTMGETSLNPIVIDTTPVIIDTTDTPVIIDTTDTPVIIDTTDTPVIIDTTDTPVIIDTTDTPVIIDTTDTPVIIDTPTDNQTTAGETSLNPIVIDNTNQPLTWHQKIQKMHNNTHNNSRWADMSSDEEGVATTVRRREDTNNSQTQQKRKLHQILNSFQKKDSKGQEIYIGENFKDPRFFQLNNYLKRVENHVSIPHVRGHIGELNSPVSVECRAIFLKLKDVLDRISQNITVALDA
jgi:hypothetical protein